MNAVFNKLAFNGYRVFLLHPPNWKVCTPGQLGILSYQDFMDTGSLGNLFGDHFPSAKEIATHLAGVWTHTTRKLVTPWFVNDSNHQRIWESEPCRAHRLTSGSPTRHMMMAPRAS